MTQIAVLSDGVFHVEVEFTMIVHFGKDVKNSSLNLDVARGAHHLGLCGG